MTLPDDAYRGLHHQRLACGKNLLELSTYDGVAWWWSTHFMFYFALDRLLEAGTATKPPRFRWMIRVLGFLGPYFDLVYSFLLKYVLEALRRTTEHPVSPRDPHKQRILFVSSDTDWRTATDYRSKSSTKTDALFHSTIGFLKDGFEFVGTYPIDLYPIRGLRAARQKWASSEFRFVSLNAHWSLRTWRKQREAAARFKSAWKQIKDDRRLAELCRVGDLDLYQQVRSMLELHFLCVLPLAVKYAEMGAELIRVERPKAFLIKNEYGWRERGYSVVAAKKQGIPAVALQHGNIYPGHPGYIYLKSEVSEEGTFSSPYCPLPDLTLVYGPYYHRLLTAVSAYPESALRVTGQPRYDVLLEARSFFSRDEYVRTYGIDPGHRILLWTTQSHGLSREENDKTWKAVFRAIERLENITLLIKQHPGEGNEYGRRIGECLRNFDITAVLVPKNSDTYAHLACCDAMMTKFSTTATEGIVLDKPVIIVNLSGEPDRVEYVQQGVAHGVYNEEDLGSAITRALTEIDQFKENRQKFKETYLFRSDGRATERVARVIESVT